MFNKVILAFIVGIFGLSQPVFAITIINQTDSDKIIKIEEAYRPASDKPGDLAAPISLGYRSEKIKIPAHSIQTIPLKATAPVLLVTVISKKKDDKKTTTTENTTCYEPYDFQDQQEEYFTDDWGFVIHKPIEGKYLPFSNRNYWDLEMAKKQGYGIKCFHPLLLVKVTSLEELPEDLKMHFAGNAPMSVRKS
jgi:hypothetical protein